MTENPQLPVSLKDKTREQDVTMENNCDRALLWEASRGFDLDVSIAAFNPTTAKVSHGSFHDLTDGTALLFRTR